MPLAPSARRAAAPATVQPAHAARPTGRWRPEHRTFAGVSVRARRHHQTARKASTAVPVLALALVRPSPRASVDAEATMLTAALRFTALVDGVSPRSECPAGTWSNAKKATSIATCIRTRSGSVPSVYCQCSHLRSPKAVCGARFAWQPAWKARRAVPLAPRPKRRAQVRRARAHPHTRHRCGSPALTAGVGCFAVPGWNPVQLAQRAPTAPPAHRSAAVRPVHP